MPRPVTTPPHHNAGSPDLWGARTDRQAAPETHVQVALDSIQEAQRLTEQAAQALSQVDGMIHDSRRVGSVSDTLTQTWYAVSAGANRLRRKGRLESRDRE